MIEAKNEVYIDRLNEKKLSNYSIAALKEYVQKMVKTGSGVTKNEMRRITMLLYYSVLKDNNLVDLLHEKFEAYSKFNQLHK